MKARFTGGENPTDISIVVTPETAEERLLLRIFFLRSELNGGTDRLAAGYGITLGGGLAKGYDNAKFYWLEEKAKE